MALQIYYIFLGQIQMAIGLQVQHVNYHVSFMNSQLAVDLDIHKTVRADHHAQMGYQRVPSRWLIV